MFEYDLLEKADRPLLRVGFVKINSYSLCALVMICLLKL